MNPSHRRIAALTAMRYDAPSAPTGEMRSARIRANRRANVPGGALEEDTCRSASA